MNIFQWLCQKCNRGVKSTEEENSMMGLLWRVLGHVQTGYWFSLPKVEQNNERKYVKSVQRGEHGNDIYLIHIAEKILNAMEYRTNCSTLEVGDAVILLFEYQNFETYVHMNFGTSGVVVAAEKESEDVTIEFHLPDTSILVSMPRTVPTPLRQVYFIF